LGGGAQSRVGARECIEGRNLFLRCRTARKWGCRCGPIGGTTLATGTADSRSPLAEPVHDLLPPCSWWGRLLGGHILLLSLLRSRLIDVDGRARNVNQVDFGVRSLCQVRGALSRYYRCWHFGAHSLIVQFNRALGSSSRSLPGLCLRECLRDRSGASGWLWSSSSRIRCVRAIMVFP